MVRMRPSGGGGGWSRDGPGGKDELAAAVADLEEGVGVGRLVERDLGRHVHRHLPGRGGMTWGGGEGAGQSSEAWRTAHDALGSMAGLVSRGLGIMRLNRLEKTRRGK